MTFTIEIPDSEAKKLAAVGITAEKAGEYVTSVLLKAASRAESDAREVRAWWESLTDEERAEERRRIDEGLAAIDAGRVTSLEDAVGRIRSRYAPRVAS